MNQRGVPFLAVSLRAWPVLPALRQRGRLPQRLRRLAPLRRALDQQRTMPRVIGPFSRAGTLLRVALIQLN